MRALNDVKQSIQPLLIKLTDFKTINEPFIKQVSQQATKPPSGSSTQNQFSTAVPTGTNTSQVDAREGIRTLSVNSHHNRSHVEHRS